VSGYNYTATTEEIEHGDRYGVEDTSEEQRWCETCERYEAESYTCKKRVVAEETLAEAELAAKRAQPPRQAHLLVRELHVRRDHLVRAHAADVHGRDPPDPVADDPRHPGARDQGRRWSVTRPVGVVYARPPVTVEARPLPLPLPLTSMTISRHGELRVRVQPGTNHCGAADAVARDGAIKLRCRLQHVKLTLSPAPFRASVTVEYGGTP
jgi:hypothetical protein